MAESVTLKRIVDMVAQTNVDDSVYIIIDSQTGGPKKYPAGSLICSIAPIFDTATAYVAGKYCNYNGKLYEFTADHAAGSWTGSDVTEVTLGDVLSDLKDNLSDIEDTLNGAAKTADVTENDADLYIADANGNVIAKFADGHIQTQNFDSSKVVGYEYKFSGSDLLISFGYTSTMDAVVVFNVDRANNLFDFSRFCTKPVGVSLKDLDTADLSNVWTSGTDMHSPFQFLAVNDPDGYWAAATDPGYTGGNHTQTIDGNRVQTATSRYVHFFADGKPVSNGSGKCTHFEIKWANNVQAYNCVKADGTGRTSLVEYHDMIFDGIRFDETVTLIPSEDIKMRFWEGFAFVGWSNVYSNVRFIDAQNRNTFIPSDSDISSGNAITSGIVAWGDDHTIELHVDTNTDLGKRDFYTGTRGAYASTANTKGYFRIIETSPLTDMSAGDAYTLCGSFRFYPAISE